MQMAFKIHPSTSLQSSSASSSSSCSSSAYVTSKTETFTVWMKSLVMQANGCTVYNSEGEIVYRVDNYETKGGNEVYLMDLKGKVLFTILKKKQWPFRKWKGYRCDGFESEKQKPFFQARKRRGVLGSGDLCCQVTLGSKSKPRYKLEASAGKVAFNITNNDGSLVAKAERKQSCSGVALGDDVLTLVVEPDVDHSFVMALVTVYGLIRRKL